MLALRVLATATVLVALSLGAPDAGRATILAHSLDERNAYCGYSTAPFEGSFFDRFAYDDTDAGGAWSVSGACVGPAPGEVITVSMDSEAIGPTRIAASGATSAAGTPEYGLHFARSIFEIGFTVSEATRATLEGFLLAESDLEPGYASVTFYLEGPDDFIAGGSAGTAWGSDTSPLAWSGVLAPGGYYMLVEASSFLELDATGQANSRFTFVLATVPEPHTGAAVGLGLVVLAARRRSRVSPA